MRLTYHFLELKINQKKMTENHEKFELSKSGSDLKILEFRIIVAYVSLSK